MEENTTSKPPQKLEAVRGFRKMRNGSCLSREYCLGQFIGKGSFGSVYVMTSVPAGQTFAGKVISKESVKKDKNRERLKSEIAIHHKMQHPNIVRFYTYFENEMSYYLLLELCPQKSLKSLVRRRGCLTEGEIQYYLKQLIGAVKYIHRCKVLHRDLKLDNVLLKGMHIKVADFGLAKNEDMIRAGSMCGTPPYMAPEIVRQERYSYPIDIWSIGIIMHALLTGNTPFRNPCVELIYKEIRNFHWGSRFPNIRESMDDDFVEDILPPRRPSETRKAVLPRTISKDAADFLYRTLDPRSERRLTLDEMLKHKFLTDSVPSHLSKSALVRTPARNTHQSTNASNGPHTTSSISQKLEDKHEQQLLLIDDILHKQELKQKELQVQEEALYLKKKHLHKQSMKIQHQLQQIHLLERELEMKKLGIDDLHQRNINEGRVLNLDIEQLGEEKVHNHKLRQLKLELDEFELNSKEDQEDLRKYLTKVAQLCPKFSEDASVIIHSRTQLLKEHLFLKRQNFIFKTVESESHEDQSKKIRLLKDQESALLLRIDNLSLRILHQLKEVKSTKNLPLMKRKKLDDVINTISLHQSLLPLQPSPSPPPSHPPKSSPPPESSPPSHLPNYIIPSTMRLSSSGLSKKKSARYVRNGHPLHPLDIDNRMIQHTEVNGIKENIHLSRVRKRKLNDSQIISGDEHPPKQSKITTD